MKIRRHVRGLETAFLDARALRRGTVLEEAELLGELFIASALAGEGSLPALLDEVSAEEDGGPYLNVSGRAEFARDVDASNPLGAEREPFPTAVHGPRWPRRRGV
jgi:hypothetical protein